MGGQRTGLGAWEAAQRLLWERAEELRREAEEARNTAVNVVVSVSLENMLSSVQALVQNEHLLAQLAERDQTIKQLEATVVLLTEELARRPVPKRALSLAQWVKGLALGGLAVVGFAADVHTLAYDAPPPVVIEQSAPADQELEQKLADIVADCNNAIVNLTAVEAQQQADGTP